MENIDEKAVVQTLVTDTVNTAVAKAVETITPTIATLQSAIEAQTKAITEAVTTTAKAQQAEVDNLKKLLAPTDIPAQAAAPVPDGYKSWQDVHNAGLFLLAATAKTAREQQHYADKLSEKGIKLHSEGNNTTGGYLVPPPQFSNAVINLQTQYGVFPQLTTRVQIQGSQLSTPKIAAGLDGYWVGEAGAITESTITTQQVMLTLNTIGGLAKLTLNLNEHSAVSLIPLITTDLARAFAYKKDEAIINGDGTSTYGGFVGLRQKITDTYSTTVGAGQYIATGNAYSEVTLDDFNQTLALLRTQFYTGAKWLMSPKFYYATAYRLMSAAGGVTGNEIAGGVTTSQFLGYPVLFSESMPKTEANSQVACLFGDFMGGAYYGTNGNVSIAQTDADSTDFRTGTQTIRGLENCGFVVHGHGTASESGTYVALTMKAS